MPQLAASADTPAVSTTKTAAKQRYLKRKARRHKVLTKARKASAPKNKKWNGGEGSASDEDDAESVAQGDEIATLADGPLAADQQAGPSAFQPVETEGAEISEATDHGGAEEVQGRAVKRQKREARDRSGSHQSAFTSEDSAIDGADPNQGEAGMDADGTARSPSPRPLVAFPLPTAPAPPNAAVLARQGLPAGLNNAVFVNQEEKVAVTALRVRRSGGEEAGLRSSIIASLAKTGVSDFFAVQAAIIPRLLSENVNAPPQYTPADILVSAPTGSGKTLAYAVPMVELLSTRRIVRLRALIVLPTKELVVQVRETMESLAKGTGLKIGSISGQTSFAQDQKQIIADMDRKLYGGSSKVDILIATPGRLIDHLESTPNFSLQHLRFLVIDEADRLLNQSFHGWLTQVLQHVNPPKEHVKADLPFGDDPADAWREAIGLVDLTDSFRTICSVQCQKLLFSATLTRDPSRIAALNLRRPEYYIVQSAERERDVLGVGEQFSVPEKLSERMIILPSEFKPLNLLHLVHGLGVRNAIVFTKSVDAAGRLANLVRFFEDAWIGEKVRAAAYTADMTPAERKRVMGEFSAGAVQFSDVVARGVDLPSVDSVISYDIPLDMRKYVHRVGRTARAGRAGTAWTLVEKQEALRFKGLLRGASHADRVQKVKIKADDVEQYRGSYNIAMKRFRELYGRQGAE